MKRSNQYPGKCACCGLWIEAHRGELSGGRVVHIGACPPPALPDARIEQAFAELTEQSASGAIDPAVFVRVVRGLLHEQRVAAL